MPISELKFIKRCAEFLPLNEYSKIPSNTRGIYALLNKCRDGKLDVIYIGMARGIKAGVRSRLRSHARKKKNLWTHFSVYEVWDNITHSEVEELEGLFRAIYRRDTQANRVNVQKGFKKLRKVRQNKLARWNTITGAK